MKNKIMTILLAAAGAAVAASPIQTYNPYVLENVEQPQLVTNAYAYAPATVYHDGQYHQFYCSSGNLSDMYYQYAHTNTGRIRFLESWDHIRYRTSKNGSDWSAPSIAISQSPNYPGNPYPSRYYDAPYNSYPPGQSFYFPTNAENCACDPAIVYSDDDEYWYLFYAGNIDNFNTVVYVARSKNIQGPYEKYAGGNSWDRMALNPTPILKKHSYRPANDPYYYGIGQVSVIKYSGKFHVWFAEMSRDFSNNGYAKRYHVAVNNITDLVNVNMDNPSQSSVPIDVIMHDSNNGLDPSDNTRWHFSDFGEVRMSASGKTGRYEMWVPDRYLSTNTYIKRYYSTNGIHWTLDRDYNVGPYNYIHNIGVSGDKHGFIYNNKYMLSFSGPDGSLYYSVDYMGTHGYGNIDVTSGMWPMWQKLHNMDWTNISVSYNTKNYLFGSSSSTSMLKYFVGDFDGDGIDELGAVQLLSNGMLKWYLRSSKSSSGHSSIWGTTWSSISRNGKIANGVNVVSGDYDGDGITDFGVVLYEKNGNNWNAYWRIHSSKTGGMGVPHIPADWLWTGLTGSHVLLNGDYDGDGKVDLVAFLPSTKTWYMISTQDGQMMDFQKITKTTNSSATSLFGYNTPTTSLFGYSENVNVSGNVVPVVGDFDGDHITDMTFVDIVKNEWYIRSSQTGNPMVIGYLNNTPGLPSPYVETANWPLVMMRSVNSYGAPSLVNGAPSNMSGAKFMSGDFDGDGISDYLAINPSNAAVMFLFSRVTRANALSGNLERLNSVITGTFTQVSNIASKEFLVGDFDGNGYSDLCVVDKQTNEYYIMFFFENLNTRTYTSRTVKYAQVPTSLPLSKIQSDEDFEPSEPKAVPTMPQPNFNVDVQEGKLIVTNASAGQKVSLFDLRGKEINHKVSNGQDVSFATPAKGMYIVRVGKKQRMVSIK